MGRFGLRTGRMHYIFLCFWSELVFGDGGLGGGCPTLQVQRTNNTEATHSCYGKKTMAMDLADILGGGNSAVEDF